MIILEPDKTLESDFNQIGVDFEILQEFTDLLGLEKYDTYGLEPVYVSIDYDDVTCIYLDQFEIDLLISNTLTEKEAILKSIFHELTHLFQFVFEDVDSNDIIDYYTDRHEIDFLRHTQNKYEKKAIENEQNFYDLYCDFERFYEKLHKLT